MSELWGLTAETSVYFLPTRLVATISHTELMTCFQALKPSHREVVPVIAGGQAKQYEY